MCVCVFFNFPFTFYWAQGLAQFLCGICLGTFRKTARKPIPSLLNHRRWNAWARKNIIHLEPCLPPQGLHRSCVQRSVFLSLLSQVFTSSTTESSHLQPVSHSYNLIHFWRVDSCCWKLVADSSMDPTQARKESVNLNIGRWKLNKLKHKAENTGKHKQMKQKQDRTFKSHQTIKTKG